MPKVAPAAARRFAEGHRNCAWHKPCSRHAAELVARVPASPLRGVRSESCRPADSAGCTAGQKPGRPRWPGLALARSGLAQSSVAGANEGLLSMLRITSVVLASLLTLLAALPARAEAKKDFNIAWSIY